MDSKNRTILKFIRHILCPKTRIFMLGYWYSIYLHSSDKHEYSSTRHQYLYLYLSHGYLHMYS